MPGICSNCSGGTESREGQCGDVCWDGLANARNLPNLGNELQYIIGDQRSVLELGSSKQEPISFLVLSA